MRLRIACLVLLLSMPLVTAQEPDPIITEIHPDPFDPAAGDREFLEIHNPASTALDLTGWRVEDAGTAVHTFDGWTIPAGGFVVLWSGGDPDALGPAFASSSVWNNDGDEARLFSPDGTVVATLAYGGHANATVASPAKGQSLLRDGDTLIQADPTPGYEEPTRGGDLAATVQDVPPEVALGSVPSRIRTGALFAVPFSITEANGDPVTWQVEDATGILAQGTGDGAQSADLTAPSTPRAWSLAVVASDGVNETRVEFVVQVASTDLEVILPSGGVTLPPLVPGQNDTDALADITLRNLGSGPITPFVDVSDFAGPGNGTIAVAGNLHIGVVADDGSVAWTEYTGPLTELPSLPVGEERDLRFRILEVPVPLSSGDYTTSFTVTAP